MPTISLEWMRLADPAGYQVELEQLPPRDPKMRPIPTVLNPEGKESEPSLLIVRRGDLLETTWPLDPAADYRPWKSLASVDPTWEGALLFVRHYGFLRRPDARRERVADIVEAIEGMKRLDETAGRRDWSAIADGLAGAKHVGQLGMLFDWREGMDLPAIQLRPKDLLAAMWAQALMDIANVTELKACESRTCIQWFPVGPGTGSRRTRYCSVRCEKAEQYRRMKEKAR